MKRNVRKKCIENFCNKACFRAFEGSKIHSRPYFGAASTSARVRAGLDCDDDCYQGNVVTLSPVSVSGQDSWVRSPATSLVTPGLGYWRWTAHLDSLSSFNGMGWCSDTSPHLLTRARNTCSALWASTPHYGHADTKGAKMSCFGAVL